MADDHVPARIHVLLARDAPVAVVLRRGPSKQVCSILWNRTDDTFTIGQWKKGRIYEDKCDISPDGQHWIYFVLEGKWESPTLGAYTVLARTPYLKAIGLWQHGDTWDGGGTFVSNNWFVIHGWCQGSVVREHRPLLSPLELEQVYCDAPPRQISLGWTAIRGSYQRRGVDHPVTIGYEKLVGCGWFLRHLLGSSSNYTICNQDTTETCELPGWQWADWDRHRLVWAEQGKLFAGEVADSGIINQRELYDFNSLRFAPIEAPY